MISQIDKAKIYGVLAATFGISQFVVCLSIAIEEYPGRYSFDRDFLSDLGRLEHPSAVWFNGTVILFGVCLLIFLQLAFQKRMREGGLTFRIFQRSGFLSSFGLIGIGCTPLDRAFYTHNVFLVLWLAPLFVMVVSSVFLFLETGHWRSVLCMSVGLVAAMCFYFLSAVNGEAPFWQKVVVTLAVIWLMLVCALSLETITYELRRVTVGEDDKTQNYLQRLEKQGMYPKSGRRSGNPYANED